jgi:hypothetical protein
VVTVESGELPATACGSCATTSNCDEEEMGTTFNPGIEQAVMLKMIKRRAVR